MDDLELINKYLDKWKLPDIKEKKEEKKKKKPDKLTD